MLFTSNVTHISIDLPLPSGFKDALVLPDSLKDAHPGRQEKFLAGRYCAMLAFKKAGANIDSQIGILPDGSPAWPSGWIGSITHHEKKAAAAVASTHTLKGLGLDFEIVMSQKTFENVASKILTGKELTSLRPLNWSEREWTTFVFSAKESIYKCFRPLCGQFFGFESAELQSVDEEGHFTYQLTQDIGGDFKAGYTGLGHFEKHDNEFQTSTVLMAKPQLVP